MCARAISTMDSFIDNAEEPFEATEESMVAQEIEIEDEVDRAIMDELDPYEIY